MPRLTYTPPQTSIYFVLYNVAAAVEEGLRWPSAVMPGASVVQGSGVWAH